MMKRSRDQSANGLGVGALLILSVLSVSAAEVPGVVPDWTLPDGAGQPVNFYTHGAERPAVILFWATWCPFCRKLMPHIEQLRQEFAPKGVNFYALNIWEDGDPAAYMEEHGFGSLLLLDADEVAKDYGVKGTPALIVVDAAHAVLYVRKSGSSPTQVETDLKFVLGNATR